MTGGRERGSGVQIEEEEEEEEEEELISSASCNQVAFRHLARLLLPSDEDINRIFAANFSELLYAS